MPALGPASSSGASSAPVAASVASLISGRYSMLFASPGSGSPSGANVYGNTIGSGAAYPVAFNASGTINQLALEIETSAASSFVRLAIYANSGGLPGTLIVDAGQLDASTTGMKTLTVSVPVVAGTVYWVGVVLQGAIGAKVRGSLPAGPEIGDTTVGTTSIFVAYGIATSGVTAAFPGSWSGTAAASGSTAGFSAIPRVLAKIA